MKELNKRRKAAIAEAILQPADFEQVLAIHGYTVVDKKVLKALCQIVGKALTGNKKWKSKN